ncbi:MAG: efflux transporter outer membrane subunit [Pseudomonadota bacterium]|nr:efflux transporter outer membrane subunit [Pseudomonadota bacterium]
MTPTLYPAQPVSARTHARPAIMLSLLALSLAACTTTSPLRTANPAPSVSVIAQDYPASPNNEQPSIAALGWQEFFADPALKSLIQLGLDNNRDFRTAALNIQRAQAQYQIRAADQLPTINSSGSITQRGNTDSSDTSYSVGLGATAYEVDLWGRVANLKDAALQNYLATQSAQQAVQISLIGQITQAYLSLGFNQEQLRLAEQTLKTQLDSLNLNRKRLDVGISSAVPVRQSEISVESARLAIANFTTLIEQDKNLLTLLVGQPVPQALLPRRAPQKITSPQVFSTGLPSDLLQNRPDLIQAEYSLRAAGANIAVARAAFYPSISLTGNLGLSSTSLSDLFSSGAFSYSFGPSISLSIFDGGARRANLEVSEVDQQLALTAYEKAIQSAFREVADVLAERATLTQRLESQARLVAATRANYNLSQARFRAGLDSYLNVLDAQRSLFSAEQSQINLQQANLMTQVNLYKALGGGGLSQTSSPADVSTANQTHVSADQTSQTRLVTTPAVGGVTAEAVVD